VKHAGEVVEILEAFDLTGSLRDAARLAGCSPMTVARYVRLRELGRLEPGRYARRDQLIDPYLAKVEEWVERSHGRVRADIVHDKLWALGFEGSERTTRSAVAAAIDDPGDAEGDRVRLKGQWMQAPTFLSQQLERWPAGLAVRAGVDLGTGRVTGGAELGERSVIGQQVGLGGHEVGLGDLDGALAAALRGRIGRHAGVDGQAVMAAGGDEDRMLDRDPRDPVDRHRPFVVRRPVRGAAAEPAKRLIDAGDHRRHGSVPGRDDDSEPATRRARRTTGRCLGR
jgi:hypothetical protein